MSKERLLQEISALNGPRVVWEQGSYRVIFNLGHYRAERKFKDFMLQEGWQPVPSSNEMKEVFYHLCVTLDKQALDTRRYLVADLQNRFPDKDKDKGIVIGPDS